MVVVNLWGNPVSATQQQRLSGSQSRSQTWSPLSGWPEEAEGQLGWCMAPSGMTAGQDVGTWPEGAANRALPPLSQGWDLGGSKSCLGTLLFLVRTENNIYLVEIYRNIVT